MFVQADAEKLLQSMQNNKLNLKLMKKLFSILVVLALLAMSCAKVDAQREAGTKFISPQLTGLDFGSYKMTPDGSDESMDLTQFGLNLAGGQFVVDNLAVKANLGYMMLKPEDSGTFSLFTIGAGVRYYLPSNLFGGFGLSQNMLTIKDPDDTKMTMSALMAALEVGYSINITEKVAFEPSLNYGLSLSGKTKVDGEDGGDFDVNRFGLSLGITVFF
jgi:hypothetical protein